MKKLFLVAAFALASQVGHSQVVDEAFKKDVIKLIDIQDGGGQEMEQMIDKISEEIPKEKRAAFVVELNTAMFLHKNKMADVYMQAYTKEDLKEALAFYESPFWKKLSDKKTELAGKTKEINMQFIQDLMPLMMKYTDK